MHKQLHKSLEQLFGFNTFRPGQEEVIKFLLQGESTAAIFPTGSGKSLCYQLAAMHLPHLTLVVSPLLALINDQIEAMRNSGIPAARIDSTLSAQESSRIRKEVREGKIKVLMISVERFKNETFRRFLLELPVSLMVVDEAHCISEWGHNFRPDYLKLPEFRKSFNIPIVLLLTATATPRVIEDMSQKFQIAKQNGVVTGFYRSNLHLRVIPTSEFQKRQALLGLLEASKNESVIVYVTLQKTAERLAAFLRENDIVVSAYHAGMNTIDREAIQDGFMNGHIPVIVATIAFGMGIDKNDIRQIIHYDLPKSLEGYSQEIGRAGRDGLKAYCTLLGNLDGVNILENFVYSDTPQLVSIKKVVDEVLNSGEKWEVQINKLAVLSDIRMLPLKTLLVYMEMEGIIKPIYSYFDIYRFKNILDNESIVSRFSGERKEFIKAIFNNSSLAKLWTTVDFDAIIKAYPSERKRIVAALDYFDEQGFISLEAKQMIEVYEVLQHDFDVDKISRQLFEKFQLKEKSEIKRIEDLISFFNNNKCLSKALSDYFGENLGFEKCGHCSFCTDGEIKLEKTIILDNLTAHDVGENLKELENKVDPALLTPITKTRFLCGLYTPLFSSVKASSMPGYGIYENYRYRDVMAVVKKTVSL